MPTSRLSVLDVPPFRRSPALAADPDRRVGRGRAHRLRRCASALALAHAAAVPALSQPIPRDLLFQRGRFLVHAEWQTATDQGVASGVPLTDGSGTFYFFTPDNVELTVKVLDACVVNGRFWVFASGLTNVAVRLTVRDGFTGETRIYERPFGVGFLPIQDTDAFASCQAAPPSCGSATAEATADTPRPAVDQRAEEAALMAGGGVVADGATFWRVFFELELIDRVERAVASFPFYPPFKSDELTVRFDPDVAQEIREGGYADWDCLNALYHVRSFSQPYPAVLPDNVRLHFDGRFDQDRVAADYSRLRGVLGVEPTYYSSAPFPLRNPPRLMCLTSDAGVFNYYYSENYEGGRRWRLTSVPEGAPTRTGFYDPNAQPPAPPPAWIADLQQCFRINSFCGQSLGPAPCAPPP